MANSKISQLTELTNPATGDFIPIVDASSSQTKKISHINFFTVPRLPAGDVPNPVNGMIIYDTAEDTFKGYADGAWGDLSG